MLLNQPNKLFTWGTYIFAKCMCLHCQISFSIAFVEYLRLRKKCLHVGMKEKVLEPLFRCNNPISVTAVIFVRFVLLLVCHLGLMDSTVNSTWSSLKTNQELYQMYLEIFPAVKSNTYADILILINSKIMKMARVRIVSYYLFFKKLSVFFFFIFLFFYIKLCLT